VGVVDFGRSTTETGDATTLASALSLREVWRRFRARRVALVAAVLLVLIVVLAFGSDLFLARDYADQDPLIRNQPPLSGHGLLGTDQFGRDMLARLLFGIRLSVGAAAFAVAVQLAIGVPLGLLAGYRGGWIDSLAMRSVDVVLAIPGLLIAMIIGLNIKEQIREGDGFFADVLRRIDELTAGLTPVMVVITFFFWVTMARLVRGEVRALAQRDYVRAARGLGAGHPRIIVHHLLRNCVGPIMVAVTLVVPISMLTESAMSLVGVGVDAPRPSLGLLIFEGAQQINSFPYQTLVPAVAFALLVLLTTFAGDGLRAALDPASDHER
jgi:oligopeptide transport system permease protein